METAKVRVKIGSLELEYEGDQGFVRSGLLSLVTEVVDLSKQLPNAPARVPGSGSVTADGGSDLRGGDVAISTIAAHLQPDGPQDLIMCALAKLQIIDGNAKVERSAISAEMKKATAYFKSGMTNNLPRDLNRMVKAKKINEISGGVYSLTAASKQDLESRLAGIG